MEPAGLLCIALSGAPGMGWQFDLGSALIGSLVTLAAVTFLYVLRGPLGRLGRAIALPVEALRYSLLASGADHYRAAVARRFHSLSLFSHLSSPERLFVQPEFEFPVPAPSADEGDDVAALADRLALRHLVRGHPHVLLAGSPGSGRTSVLGSLARASEAGQGSKDAEALFDRPLWPIYVRLAGMDWEVEPAPPDAANAKANDNVQRQAMSAAVRRLVEAGVQEVGGRRTALQLGRRRFEVGEALVLVDDWEELPAAVQPRAAAWLAGLAAQQPGNRWIVAVGECGYAPLAEAGFTAVVLCPWRAPQVDELVRKWLAACAAQAESPPNERAVQRDLRRAAAEGASPLDLAMQLYSHLELGGVDERRADLFDAVLTSLLQQERQTWPLASGRAALGQLALTLQTGERGQLSRQEIEAAIEDAMPPDEERLARAPADAFRALTGSGSVLVPAGDDKYTFAHALWRAFLVARQMVTAPASALLPYLDDPRWQAVVDFYAEMGDMAPLLKTWLERPDDLFFSRLRRTGGWAARAPDGAPWREAVMRQLARAFLTPALPASLRLALAEAIAQTRIPGVGYFLKQALTRPEPALRIAAITALGSIATEADLPVLEAMCKDPDPDVQAATLRAWGRFGQRAAVSWLTRTLNEAPEGLRMVAAEALLACDDEGIQVVREGLESPDLLVRRAAVAGLVKLDAPWVWERLQSVAVDDSQWIVRSAASAALAEHEQVEQRRAIREPIEPGNAPWLINWAAARGEGLGIGPAARHMLLRALAEGEPAARRAAVQTLAAIGTWDDLPAVLHALGDADAGVSQAALQAAEQLGKRYNLSVRRS